MFKIRSLPSIYGPMHYFRASESARFNGAVYNCTWIRLMDNVVSTNTINIWIFEVKCFTVFIPWSSCTSNQCYNTLTTPRPCQLEQFSWCGPRISMGALYVLRYIASIDPSQVHSGQQPTVKNGTVDAGLVYQGYKEVMRRFEMAEVLRNHPRMIEVI
ncbi:hypothetical protein B0F90DRAFT_1385872 [Multifurca ochricompacta]|uniref:Uncharacterized protein n=1 Tax=Multifurca ochricompacta TaxID=376703 RepID=A0AAD4M6R5_9AGAM|nr:hypothetical protein B0F90DRAFT_1385872 [Multifurca ochricompacta]